jgi:hypothetical protein
MTLDDTLVNAVDGLPRNCIQLGLHSQERHCKTLLFDTQLIRLLSLSHSYTKHSDEQKYSVDVQQFASTIWLLLLAARIIVFRSKIQVLKRVFWPYPPVPAANFLPYCFCRLIAYCRGEIYKEFTLASS